MEDGVPLRQGRSGKVLYKTGLTRADLWGVQGWYGEIGDSGLMALADGVDGIYMIKDLDGNSKRTLVVQRNQFDNGIIGIEQNCVKLLCVDCSSQTLLKIFEFDDKDKFRTTQVRKCGISIRDVLDLSPLEPPKVELPSNTKGKPSPQSKIDSASPQKTTKEPSLPPKDSSPQKTQQSPVPSQIQRQNPTAFSHLTQGPPPTPSTFSGQVLREVRDSNRVLTKLILMDTSGSIWVTTENFSPTKIAEICAELLKPDQTSNLKLSLPIDSDQRL